MPQTVAVGTRVTPEFRERIDVLARALNRERAWVIDQAIKRYLNDEEQFRAAVERGRADIAAGRVTDWAVVEAELDQIEADAGPRS